MEYNNNLNDLWAKQCVIEPKQEALFFQIKKMKQTSFRKMLITNSISILVLAFIILIWVYFQPQFLTTKIGIVLIILSITIFLLFYNNTYSIFKDKIKVQSNKDYLNDLLILKSKQLFMQTTILNLYFVLLSTGISLYMYEYASRMSMFGGVLTYGITALWILFNWFKLRPMQIKKEQDKLDGIIHKFENISDQLDD